MIHTTLTVTIVLVFFFFNDTATTKIYTLSLHDALPISHRPRNALTPWCHSKPRPACGRSEEHTSELQSRFDLVCRLLLEKKNLAIDRCPSYKLEFTIRLSVQFSHTK